MLVSHRWQGIVNVELVGVDLRTLFDVIGYNRHDGMAAHVGNFAGFEFAAALHHPEYSSFVFRTASACAAAHLAAKVRLVYFHLAHKWIEIFGENIAHFFAHSPSGFIGDTRLTLNLFGRNPAACLRHEVNHVEPNGQRGRGLVEHRIGSRGNVESAMVARVRFSSAIAVKQTILTALRAINTLRELLIADVIQAHVIIWKHLLEVFEREFHHRRFFGLGSHCRVLQ